MIRVDHGVGDPSEKPNPYRTRVNVSRPFGRPHSFDPKTGKHTPLDNYGAIEVFEVVEVGAEVLYCEDYDNLRVLVKSVLGATYAVGDTLLAGRMTRIGVTATAADGDGFTTVATGDHPNVEWEDLCVGAGRARRAQIVSEGDESIQVWFYDADEVAIETLVEVSKPPGLRKQDYNGLTYDGATYTYVSAGQRTADGATQDIIPSYRVGTDVFVDMPVSGTGLTDVYLMDDNRAWRAWLES